MMLYGGACSCKHSLVRTVVRIGAVLGKVELCWARSIYRDDGFCLQRALHQRH